MMRALIVLLFAMLAPALAADAPSPGGGGEAERSQSYVLVSVEKMHRIEALLERMTEALQQQDDEIRRLRRLTERGGCA